jgi:dCMP deaminase
MTDDCLSPDAIRRMLRSACSHKEACKKHQIGALIECADKKYVLGWNGAPTGIRHDECTRAGYASGEGMHLCPTVHAERRAISHAAKTGVATLRARLYLSEWFPCADCSKSIIEAGITHVITPDEFYSDNINHLLVPKLRNQSYNFEMAEELMREAGLTLLVDSRMRL